MRRLFPILMILFLVAGCCGLFGCRDSEPTADRVQAEQTEKALGELNRQIGLPNITNFQQKKIMKMVYELCDRTDLICYAYLKADMTGQLSFLGKCIGFGIPFAAQYTNPEKVIQGDHALGYDVSGSVNFPMKLPQADPNGLFMPTSSSATWLIMIDPETNEPTLSYVEPEIVVLQFPLKPEHR